VLYSNPQIPIISKIRQANTNLEILALNQIVLPDFDALLCGTEHDHFSYHLIQLPGQLTIDTRERRPRNKSEGLHHD
jgi:hypothetical protein